MVSNESHGRRWFVPLLWCSAVCVAQVSGRFYLEKDTYAPDEPVFLYLEVMNDSPDGQNVLRAGEDGGLRPLALPLREKLSPPPTVFEMAPGNSKGAWDANLLVCAFRERSELRPTPE